MLVPNVHKIEAEIISQLQINLPQCLEYLDLKPSFIAGFFIA